MQGLRLFATLVLLSTPMAAQYTVDYVGSNYQALERIGPGQVLDILVRAGKATLPEGRATIGAWPRVLNGISIKGYLAEDEFVWLRIGSILRTGDGLYTVRAQFPFEAINYPSLTSTPQYNLTFSVLFGAVELGSIRAIAAEDSIQLETECDGSAVGPPSPFQHYPARSDAAARCPIVFRHGSGAPVTRLSPARAGERVHVLVRGLGPTDPPTLTGEPFREGLKLERALTRPDWLRFTVDFSTNAGHRLAYPPEVTEARSPINVTPVADSVGLYRIDFMIPPLPADRRLLACTGLLGFPREVLSNATVNFFAFGSSAGGGICLDPDSQ